MGYYSHGEGRVEKIDPVKAKQFIDKYGRHYNLDLVFSEEDASLELRFSYSAWYVEDDFPEEGKESCGSGIFRDLREILTTEPAMLHFTGEDRWRYLVLITPTGAARPYLDIEMVCHPVWDQVPDEYAEVVGRWFGVCETTSCKCESLAKKGKGQKLIDREMEKFDVPQEGIEAQYYDDPIFREFVDRQFNEVAVDAPFEDMVTFAFGSWEEAIEEFHKLYPKDA